MTARTGGSVSGPSSLEVGKRFAAARKARNLTQQAASAHLGISRSALSQLESGVSLPSFETLRQAQKTYAVSYAYLLDGQETPPPAPPAPKDGFSSGPARVGLSSAQPHILSVTVDSANNPNIVLVPVKAQAGYAAARLEPERMQELPAFNLPGYQYRNNTFRAFEVAGDSMEPTVQNGDILVCAWMENRHHLWPGELFVFVLQDDVLIKRVDEYDEVAGEVVVRSDNQFYRPFRLRLEEVVEVWRVQARITQHLPAPGHLQAQLRAVLQEFRREGA